MAKTNIQLFETSGYLFLDVPDTKLGKILNEVLALGRRFPEIIEAVIKDLELAGKNAKMNRLRVREWEQAHTPDLPWESIVPAGDLNAGDLCLEQGRPRMPSEVVYVFLALRGYLGSVSDQKAAEQFADSITLRNYFETKNIRMPAPRTILDNVSHVTQDTRDLIFDCQMTAVTEDGLDDLRKMTADSTSVWSNSQWPTDSEMICKLLERVYRKGRVLHAFGLPRFRQWKLPAWLKKLDQLSFKIANCSGKPRSRRKRKKLYREVRRIAQKAVVRLDSEWNLVQESYAPEAVSPLVRDRLSRFFSGMQEDLAAVERVCEYNRKRIEEDVSVPSAEKVLSVSDPDVAMIVKGGREPVLGYKPQLARTQHGFISAVIFETGNVSDAKSLMPLAEKHQTSTGIWPEIIVADDGYASRPNRKELLAQGTLQVSFSGGTGKKVMPEEEWDDPDFLALRNSRSAVESVIFTLKHCFNFDRVRRRGIAAVRQELTENIIAHNFWRMALMRERKGKPPALAAAG